MRVPLNDAPSDKILTVAITGGTGFIGKAVISRLLQDKICVRALVRPASLSSSFNARGLTWVCGELDNEENLRQLLEGADVAIYCAGSVRGTSAKDFAPANISGVEKILEVARGSADLKRFLLISSLAAKVPELSPYASSKRQGEEILRTLAHGIDWTIIRPPAVYGPGDEELLPLFKWMRRGLLFVPGGGDSRFSLVFIKDLTEAVIAWLMNDVASGSCFELHDGKTGGYCWEEVREIASDLYHRPVRRIDIPNKVLEAVATLNTIASNLARYRPMLTPGKVKELCHPDWVCDNLFLSSATKWHPEFDLRRGLQLTLR